MTWTTEWPTEPGFYFCFGGSKDSDYYRLMVCDVRKAGPEDKLFTMWVANGHFIYQKESNIVFWNEPISEPPQANKMFAQLYCETSMEKMLEDSSKPWTKVKIETPYQLAAGIAKVFGLDENNPPMWLLEMAVSKMK